MRRLLVAALTALASGSAAQAQGPVCAGDLPPPKLVSVGKPPAPEPQAVAVLRMQGLPPRTALYRASAAAVRDFPYMRELALKWRLGHDQAALDRLGVYLVVWARTYRPAFNPIDEAPFSAFMDAYAVAAPDLSDRVRARVRPFLRRMTQGYLQRMRAHRAGRGHWVDAWESRRVELAALGAWALADDDLMAQAREAYLHELGVALTPQGAPAASPAARAPSEAVAVLDPLARAAVAARNRGQHWLDLRAPGGRTLRPGLDWLEPWAQGRRWTHEGGGYWTPQSAGDLYWAASLLDRRYLATAQRDEPSPPHWIWAQAPCGGAS